MKRTTVMLDEHTYEQLREIARRRRTTSSGLIREALARYVADEGRGDVSPLAPLIGIFDGPATDVGARAEEIFAEHMAEKSRRRADDADR
jgi:hypothetical protein